jgi:hypothetical protein
MRIMALIVCQLDTDDVACTRKRKANKKSTYRELLRPTSVVHSAVVMHDVI